MKSTQHSRQCLVQPSASRRTSRTGGRNSPARQGTSAVRGARPARRALAALPASALTPPRRVVAPPSTSSPTVRERTGRCHPLHKTLCTKSTHISVLIRLFYIPKYTLVKLTDLTLKKAGQSPPCPVSSLESPCNCGRAKELNSSVPIRDSYPVS